jgi:hypothetical protein
LISGDVLSKNRNRFVDGSARAIMLVKSWMGQQEVHGWEVAEEEAAANGEWGDEGVGRMRSMQNNESQV